MRRFVIDRNDFSALAAGALPFSIDEKGSKESRARKPKLHILENFKCGGVIFEQVLSFPVLLKLFFV
ncbi:hypothetical protein DF185_08445 [Marinifilum breve]|uniref:Uncharacterized protein n=1 Tax=Marinifilum breve TaxID=2184082 RepID=A0A2V4ABV7_9BACT|nr:hypothetical protein DF185_08445 [Marinifilum breve]